MKVIDLKWFASNRFIFSSDGVLTEPSYQNKLYNMTALKTHKTVFTGTKQSLGKEQFPALPSTYLPWVGCCLLFYQRRVLLCSIPRLYYQTPPGREARSCGSTGSQERKWKQERERSKGVTQSSTFTHCYCQLPLLYLRLPSQPGWACRPRSARKTCRQQGVTKG